LHPRALRGGIRKFKIEFLHCPAGRNAVFIPSPEAVVPGQHLRQGDHGLLPAGDLLLVGEPLGPPVVLRGKPLAVVVVQLVKRQFPPALMEARRFWSRIVYPGFER
jgi:hypothetical protein